MIAIIIKIIIIFKLIIVFRNVNTILKAKSATIILMTKKRKRRKIGLEPEKIENAKKIMLNY